MELILFLLVLYVRECVFFDIPGSLNHCGIDYSPTDRVYEGFASVETYPWLGRLYYPIDGEKVTTIVVLITIEMVIGPAFDIDKYPKNDFRAKSKVVLGCNCSGPHIGIKDYIYHPDYRGSTLSALAIVQLDILKLRIKLHPICMTPSKIQNPNFYAMTLARDCEKSKVRIYEMTYVDPGKCNYFYRKTELDVDSMWPTHTVCARALSGGNCVWRHGAVLVLKEHKRWKLAGIGVYGPGCETPARFLDYGMYHAWVRSSITRIGMPAVTRMAPNHLILRRSLSSMQRFGECDPEETDPVIFSDETTLHPEPEVMSTARYNLTLFKNVDYTCVNIRVDGGDFGSDQNTPLLSLRRWCLSPMPACYEFQSLQVDFYVEMQFTSLVKYQIVAYGREVTLIDRKAFMVYTNRKRPYPKPYTSPFVV